MSTPPPHLLSLLRRARQARGWSQRQVAEAVGTNRFTVTRWELGTAFPSPHFRQRLCELFGTTAEALGFLQEAQAAPREPETLWLVPYPRNRFFTGREDLLDRLHAQLTQEKATALTQSLALSGLGGIGKTQVALEYAYRYAAAYSAIFWMAAETEERLLASLTAMAEVVPLPERHESDQRKLVAALFQWLSRHQGWLLIVDNVEELALVQPYLPATRSGTLLFTTRLQALGTLAEPLEVGRLRVEEGMQLVLRRARRLATRGTLEAVDPEERLAARAIVETLDGLPLALDQAGAYLEETGCCLADYLERYHAQRVPLLARRGASASAHPDSVLATFQLASQRLELEHPHAWILLRVCAFLHAEAIPEELFEEALPGFDTGLSDVGGTPYQFDLALAALRRLSLVQRQTETRTLSMHRLVQAVVQASLSPSEYAQAQQWTLEQLLVHFPEVRHEVWGQCERLLAHVLTCSAALSDQAGGSKLADLLRKVADYLRERGQYAPAEPLYERALRLYEQSLGAEHSQVATVLDGLAELAVAQGQYQHAQPLYERALALYEKSLGVEHPQVAAPLHGLARVFFEQGQYEQAEALFQRAALLREQGLGPGHPLVATSLNGLANLAVIRGEYEQAEALYQRSLHILEQALGAEHPQIAALLNNLAYLSFEQGKDEQAEALYQRTLRIWERALGPDHRNVATPLNNLARLYAAQRKDDLAEQLYQRALGILEQALGPDHHNVAVSLDGLANLAREQGAYEQTEALGQRALGIRERVLGSRHPQTATSLHTLALLAHAQGREAEAEVLFQRALLIREAALVPAHRETLQSMDEFADFYHAQDRKEEARLLWRRAAMGAEQALGSAHPLTQRLMQRLVEVSPP